jgi:primosomal protein N' (replication factor Y)
MIAEVIVDVPATPTDQPYDYVVPEELQSEIFVGSRVEVPFGRQRRMGYVIDLKEETLVKRLRRISTVMDFEPPLTPELIELGAWMAEEYLCHRVTALQAMLPAALKGKYRKLISLSPQVPADAALPASLLQVLQQKGFVEWDEVLSTTHLRATELRRYIRQGWLQLHEEVGDHATQKRVRMVRPALEVDSLRQIVSELPKRKKKQIEILSFFCEHPQEIPLSELLLQLSTTRTTVQKCVEAGWLIWEDQVLYRDPYQQQEFAASTPLPLTGQQAQAFQQIAAAIEQPHSETLLLHGVTGSGKTEIYLQAIAQVLERGEEAIVLVPEISLTPQMVERFKSRFGERVAVLHSALSKGEKYDEWRKLRAGECQVAIGARSAIFAPFTRLGLIIMDEEHESSYKQEDHPKYHARVIAQWRASYHGAALILGSATPAVETYFDARSGRYQYLQLNERVQGRSFPTVHLVDMREELQQGNRSMFSQPLQQALLACADRGEQAILFLNRRGFSTFVLCRECGEAVTCPHCDITLTYHRTNDTLRCHYCGYAMTLPVQCPQCESRHIRHFGAGTQRVEKELQRLFPQLRVIRMDVDTTSRKGAHQRLLQQFAKGQADILLGTQMIAKGLDFPHVTLVGVIAADSMLHLPDFRAAERTYQLLTQVSGRAGRHQHPGQVVVQTYQTDHYSIQMMQKQQEEAFYRQESLLRKRLHYPPFCELFQFLLTHPDRVTLLKKGQQLAARLQQQLPPSGQLLGPVPAVIPRIKDLYRLQILIKVADEPTQLQQVKRACRNLLQEQDKELRISIDREGRIFSPVYAETQ